MKTAPKLLLAAYVLGAAAAQGNTIFQDNFSTQGTHLDYGSWTTEIGFGSQVGRTQLTDWVTPGGGGQFVVGATGARLALDTFNPNFNPNSPTLFGTHAKTLQAYQPATGNDLSFTTRLQLTSLQPGLVYGMYLLGNNLDAIDIELVSNDLQPGGSPLVPLQVELNRFTTGSPETGDGGLANLPLGFDPLIAHDWTINWSAGQINYLVDSVVLASVSTRIPQSALRANELIFGPSTNWAAAYSASLQPVTSAASDQSFNALLTSVTISDSSVPEPSTWALALLGLLFFVRRLRTS